MNVLTFVLRCIIVIIVVVGVRLGGFNSDWYMYAGIVIFAFLQGITMGTL